MAVGDLAGDGDTQQGTQVAKRTLPGQGMQGARSSRSHQVETTVSRIAWAMSPCVVT